MFVWPDVSSAANQVRGCLQASFYSYRETSNERYVTNYWFESGGLMRNFQTVKENQTSPFTLVWCYLK